MADFELPGYELYERLGRGGMATVYRALHLNLDREVAIKVMDPGMNSDENFSERFIREARISARLTHPHILQIYDVNTFDGYNYIAMELLGAGELSDFIHAEMPQKQIYTIMRHMTEALDYAAGRGYVHRDIKPSNIMMRDTEDFVLADFGIARAANSGTQMTQTGLMVGTPSYMSPEQAKGQEVDGRSDLYALVVLAYEMLTKTLPYESDSAVTTAVKHLTEDIPTLPEHLEAYQAFLNKGLAKAADDRFQTGEELYQAFMEASSGFADDQVLTEGIEAPKAATTDMPIDESAMTSVAGMESTRLSHSSSPAVSSSSRPYRLEAGTQRERLVSGTYANNGRTQSKSGGSVLRMLVVVVVLAGAGFGGYTWWQGQQGGASKDQRAVTAELAKAFSAMNEENLTVAASSFYKVLSMDSRNDAAQQGMEEVGVLYTAEIDKAIADKDIDKARQMLIDYGGYFADSNNLERMQAEIDLLSEENNLANVQSQRVQKFLSQVDASIEVGDFDQAHELMARAAAIEPDHPGLDSRRSALESAQAQTAAYEELWSKYTPAQRDEFNAKIALADEALDQNDLAAAKSAIEEAREIAADAPELTSRMGRIEAAQTQVAEALVEEQARVDALLDEADAAVSGIAADPSNAAVALATYQEVAAQYPDNQRVKKGLASISGFYLNIARAAVKEGDFEGAQQALGSGQALLPDSAEIAKMQADLPSLEQAWIDKQAAIAQQKEEEAAARAEAEEAVASAERAISSGALELAQSAYDDVVQSYADLPAVKSLGNNLRKAYGDAARSQIDVKEFDAAQEYLAQGAVHFPDDPSWKLLEEEIETAKTNSRRRLGAY
ncbi:MAG: protein kinase [Halioglobus sp.]